MTFLSHRTLATDSGLISSVSSIVSSTVPLFIGWTRDTIQSSTLTLQVLALLITLGALLVLRIT